MTKIIDITTRKPLGNLDLEDSTSAEQFLSLMKKRFKEQGVQSVFILTINKDRFVNWGMVTASELHLLLAYATLDDLKEEIRDQIFPDTEEEEDDPEAG